MAKVPSTVLTYLCVFTFFLNFRFQLVLETNSQQNVRIKLVDSLQHAGLLKIKVNAMMLAKEENIK